MRTIEELSDDMQCLVGRRIEAVRLEEDGDRYSKTVWVVMDDGSVLAAGDFQHASDIAERLRKEADEYRRHLDLAQGRLAELESRRELWEGAGK